MSSWSAMSSGERYTPSSRMRTRSAPACFSPLSVIVLRRAMVSTTVSGLMAKLASVARLTSTFTTGRCSP